MRVGVLDRNVDDIAGLQRGRHVAQIDRAVDLGRIGLAAPGGADGDVPPIVGFCLADLVDDEVDAAHLAGDGFISLSFQENFGYAAAEAVAYGLPVILSPGHDLAHEMPALDGRFACGWLLGDDAHATAVAAIREWAGASEATRAAAGGVGRSWVAEALAFERFRERLAVMV